jgi:hypothetical protein
MKIQVISGILMTIFILGDISTVAAASDGYSVYTTKGDSLEFDLLYDE